MAQRLPRVAVIGAGVTGLTCAALLARHSIAPVVYEKSRGLGGRVATRRRDDGLTFDHGAQYFTARSASFRALVDDAQRRGEIRPWMPVTAAGERARDEPWFVGVPTMNAWLKPYAEGLDLRTQAEAVRFVPDGVRWRIAFKSGETSEPYDLIVSSAPVVQARLLAVADPALVSALADVVMAPCWAVMAAFESRVAVDLDVARPASDALAWVARNGTKPGRGDVDTWVLHGSPAWSTAHLEDDAADVERVLLQTFADLVGALPAVRYATAHRWRYALTTRPLGQPYATNAAGTLFLGGDWTLGPRIECAHDSGVAMAAAVLQRAGVTGDS